MLASELCSAVVVVHASINGSKLILHELGGVGYHPVELVKLL